MLPSAGAQLVLSFLTNVPDSATGAWLRRWKHWAGVGCDTLHLHAICWEMHINFVRCWQNGTNYKRRVTFLAKVHRRSKVPSAVAVDPLTLLEVIGRLYIVCNWTYASHESHLKTQVPRWQRLFAGWRNIELFSMLIFDKANFTCVFPNCWRLFQMPTLLLVPRSLVLSYHSRLGLRRSTKD